MINDSSKPWGDYIRARKTGGPFGFQGFHSNLSHPQRMIREGHQVASHTWSHQNASQLTDDQFTRQMIWNEIALYDILGFIPTYMRSYPVPSAL